MKMDRPWSFSDPWQKAWLLMTVLMGANRYQPKNLSLVFSYYKIDWQRVKVNSIYPNLEESREILFFLQEIEALEIEEEIEVQIAKRFFPAIWKLKLNRQLFNNAYNEVSQQAGIVSFETKARSESKPAKVPSGWDFIRSVKKPEIKKDGKLVFVFPTNWSKRYKYFECLWSHHRQKVDFKTVYEYASDSSYPPKRPALWKVNKGIDNEINKLRNDFKLKKLPLDIDTAKGFTLTLYS